MNWPSIPRLVKEITSGVRSVESVVASSLSQAEAASDYHALLELNERALERARELDEIVKRGRAKGRLFGVPFVAKDNFLTRETKTTAASLILKDFEAPYQATAIERLEAEGAVLIGKANLDEFAHGSSTENSAFGPTKNPVDPTRVPGGSSGGSAAAVAAGIVPFALGTDTGGSIRLPASFCGVVGYKPTYGLVSRFGVIAMASSTDVIGPITTSVSDSAYILDVIAGRDTFDSTTIERENSYELVANGKDLSGVTIGIIKEHLSEDLDSSVRVGIEKTITRLKEAGAAIKTVELPLNELALAVYYIIAPAEISSNLARYDGVKYGLSNEKAKSILETYLSSRAAGFGAEPIRRILTGTYVLSSGYQDAYYKQAQKVRTMITQEYARVLDGVDVLLGPTAPTPAFALGDKQDPLSMYLSDVMTIGANLAGIPAISIPLSGFDLPIGLQLQAAQNQDRQLLEIAASIEGMV